MQETWVGSLVWEEPTCLGASKFLWHNCSSPLLEHGSCNKRRHATRSPLTQRESSPHTPQPEKRLSHATRSLLTQRESSPHPPQPEKSLSSNEDPAQLKINKQMKLLLFFKEDYCNNPIEIGWYLRLGRWESGEMVGVCTLCRALRVGCSFNQKHTGERSIRDDPKCLAEGRSGRL